MVSSYMYAVGRCRQSRRSTGTSHYWKVRGRDANGGLVAGQQVKILTVLTAALCIAGLV